MVRPTFSPRLPGGVKACQDGLEYFFFSIFAHLTEGRGGYLGNAHIEPTNFKKGASLTSISKCWIRTRCAKNCFGCDIALAIIIIIVTIMMILREVLADP